MMAAVTYFIAGKSNCPFFAKAQRIGEIITRNLPAVSVRIQTQHPQEWPAYLDALCARLQFAHKTSPIVYTHLGTLVGGSDAFHSLVSKMYGNIAEFPMNVLNDIATENHDQAVKEMNVKETTAHNKVHQDQWELRNERLQIIGGKVVDTLNKNIESVSQLFQSCQNVKATLNIAPEKHSMVSEPAIMQKHLGTLTQMLPKIDQISLDSENLSTIAESLGTVPSNNTNATPTSRFSCANDEIWKLMLLDHQKKLNEFVSALHRMYEANEAVQIETSKLVQNSPAPTPPKSQSPSSSLPPSSTISTNSETSPFSIPVDKLYKSVSYAGVDTQYSPKDPSKYYSLPSTPKKDETGVEGKEQNTPIAPPVDVVPLQNAIQAMRAAVDEGLGILKHTKKQLRINLDTAKKQVALLQPVLDHDEFRHFKLRERREIGKNVHLYRFDLPLPGDVLGCPIGKHIKVRIGDSERAYSPITTDIDKGYFDLAIKVTRDTPIMDLFSNLQPGDWMEVRGPSGAQIFKESEKVSGIAMFAHGVGLTPMLQVIRHHLSQEDDSTPLWLLYFNTEERMIMKDELERLSTAHTRFNLRCLTSKPGNHWEHMRPQDLISSLPFRPSGFDYSTEANQVKILICGTRNFTKKTKSLLMDMGYRDETIHTFD